MNPAQLINQTSGNAEYFTPAVIIEAASAAMGGIIELDPASSAEANKIVKAERFYTKKEDGLSQDWSCSTLWLNHPFGRGLNERWIRRLTDAVEHEEIILAACCITYACTSEEWFRPLLDQPQCFLWPRTNYLSPDGATVRGVTKGSVVSYFGRDMDRFRYAFKGLGTIKI